MELPSTKKRQGKEFQLLNDFHCKIDAQRELNKRKNQNSLFGKKLYFVFSSQNTSISLRYGVYEQVFYAEVR